MKPRPVEYILCYASSAFCLLAVFHGSLGLSNTAGNLFFVGWMAGFYCFWRSWYPRARAVPGVIQPLSEPYLRWIGPGALLVLVAFLIQFAIEFVHQ